GTDRPWRSPDPTAPAGDAFARPWSERRTTRGLPRPEPARRQIQLPDQASSEVEVRPMTAARHGTPGQVAPLAAATGEPVDEGPECALDHRHVRSFSSSNPGTPPKKRSHLSVPHWSRQTWEADGRYDVERRRVRIPRSPRHDC